jgi:hypothetical protein
LDFWLKPALYPARCSKHLQGRPQRNVRIKRFPRVTLVASYFEDAVYERMQAAELERAQVMWRKSGGRISVTARSSGPLFSLALTAEIQTRYFPQIELVPFVYLKPWLDLAQRQEEELDSTSDEELGGGFHRRPFSFFADPCSGSKNSESLAVVDVCVDVLDPVRTC